MIKRTTVCVLSTFTILLSLVACSGEDSTLDLESAEGIALEDGTDSEGSDGDEQQVGSEIDGEPLDPYVACGGQNGDWSYCNSLCPCDDGEGDCDSDAECKLGLECIHDIGADFGWSSAVDVCMDMESLTVTNGMKLWLRADAGVYANGSGVYRWDDQSIYDNDAYTNTTSRYPARINNAVNGKPVLRFYGDDFLGLEQALQLDDMTIFVVAKNNNPSNTFHMILGTGGSYKNNQFRFQSSSQVLFAGYSNNMPIITTSVGNNKVYHSLSVTYNGSSWQVRRDGDLKSTTNFAASGTWDLLSVGAWYSQYPLKGDIAEIIVYDRQLSSLERGSVQNYLDSKYNLP